MSLTRQFRLIAPRLQQCLYTTGGSSAGSGGSAGKADKTTEKKASTTKEKAPPAPTKAKAKAKEPFDNTKYQCNTYYEHKMWTFYDIESQMASKRIGQPSPFAKKAL